MPLIATRIFPGDETGSVVGSFILGPLEDFL